MKRNPKLFVPAITPFAADLSIDEARFLANARTLLDQSADGLAPFGTTSEAASLGLDERKRLLAVLIEGGIDPSRLMPGTGAAALPEAIALTRDAVANKCLGTLTLPPFYYKGVTEDGVYAYYAQIVEAVGSSDLKIYLYHIPQMSGVAITLSLIERLLKTYPGVFVGLKDSSGDWDNTHAIIKAFPELDVYSASESLIGKNVAAGGAGCISASANVNTMAIAALIKALGTEREAGIAERVAEVRKRFESLPLIPAVKAVTAILRGDPAYEIVRPPFAPVPDSLRGAINDVARLCAPTQV
ncbi:dihydrodipicolinate synthase family protein [Pelagibacterium lentulum]|uniref:Dihydrodipicolinate synthase family protein n=1 Tax=Pelagibacterium lentulum TaxID=2029865 RepID=A0A916RGM0_9HYPH|nr:dihydrodipicolinate synthase family protein [Pelagibacterium lentulum]GGA55234.1 dihydrodipicolinate synthase family protein [Pelagibacterium lentulum]